MLHHFIKAGLCLSVLLLIGHAQTIAYVHGTIVIVQKDNVRFLVVADSRIGHADNSYTDDACKIIALDDKHFASFSGDQAIILGKDRLFDMKRIPTKIFQAYGQPHAKSGFRNLADRIGRAAAESLQDLIRSHPDLMLAIMKKENPYESKAVLGGITDDGQLIAYKILVHVDRATMLPTYAVDTIGEVNFFGSHYMNGAIEFWNNRSSRAKEANHRMQLEIARTHSGDAQVIRLKWAAQMAIDWAGINSDVGGPLDILELRKDGKIHWINRKKNCNP